MRNLLCICFAFFVAIQLQAQDSSILGKWKTVDDETGEEKSVVEIYEENGKVYGKVVAISNPNDRDKTCIKCEGDEYNAPIIGLNIIKGLSEDDGEYSGGTIFDPEKGKQYKAKLWVDEDDASKLNVRGYIAFLYRTQQWLRAE